MSKVFTVAHEGNLYDITEAQHNMLTILNYEQRKSWIADFVKTAGKFQEAPIKSIEPKVANSVATTLAQRGSRYGDFTDHACICQELKDVMTGCTKANPEYPDQRIHGWQLLSSVQRQALEVIVDKIARILSGDPNYDDNWHDIQGYAKLVEDRLPKESK